MSLNCRVGDFLDKTETPEEFNYGNPIFLGHETLFCW